MNTILIISIILTIVAAYLYWMAKREVNTLKHDINHFKEVESINYQTIEKQKEKIGEVSITLNQVIKERDETYESLERAESEYSKCEDLLNAKKEELANFQQLILEHEKSKSVADTKVFEAVFIDQLSFKHKGEISTNSLIINSALLIGDNRLFDVLKRLINSKLLPDSITEKSGLNVKDLSITVWTQKFTEEGEYDRCMTWREIIQEMMDKKNLITDYLNNVIQESNRAMVVHSALTEKNTKEEVVS
mgnify:CR=1 FL=1